MILAMRRPRTTRAATTAGVLVLLSTTLLAPASARPAVVAAPADASAGTPAAWAEPAMARVRRGADPRIAPLISIAAARGEAESFQVAVHADGGALTGATVEVSDLDGPGGARIDADQLTLYREHFVKVPDGKHSPPWSGPVLDQTWFADALVPFLDPATGKPPDQDARYPASPFAVWSGRTQPVWIDVEVPRNAKAGTYEGTWTVTSDQGTVSGEVELEVWDFTLPVASATGSSFGVYRRPQRTREMLVEYGLQPDPVHPSRESEYIDKGLHSAELGFWSGAFGSDCEMEPAPRPAEVRAAVARHDPGLRLYNYTADEISQCTELYPEIKQYARRLHAEGVEQLITMVPVPELMDDGTGELAVDIWPLLPLQHRTEVDPALRDEILDRGGELWSYQALVQGRDTPSWQIDFPAANYRILPGFLNQRMGLTGTLYWTVDWWSDKPWRDVITDDFGCCYPGDGMLVYPGRQAGVVGSVPSIRLPWVRDGIDDYGYVQILRDRGLGQEAMSIIDPAAHSWKEWSQDPDVLESVRAELAAAIVASNPAET